MLEKTDDKKSGNFFLGRRAGMTRDKLKRLSKGGYIRETNYLSKTRDYVSVTVTVTQAALFRTHRVTLR